MVYSFDFTISYPLYSSPGQCECYSQGFDDSVGYCGYGGQCPCNPSMDPVHAAPYCEPYVSGVFPLYGVESGGTNITIHGYFLQDVVGIEVGELPCAIHSR